MPPLLLVTCLLALLASVAPSTLLNVQLDPTRSTQLYRAPAAGGGAGAWIITAHGPHRPSQDTKYQPNKPESSSDVFLSEHSVDSVKSSQSPSRWSVRPLDFWTQKNTVDTEARKPASVLKPVSRPKGGSKIKLPSFTITSRPFGLGQPLKSSAHTQNLLKPNTQPKRKYPSTFVYRPSVSRPASSSFSRPVIDHHKAPSRPDISALTRFGNRPHPTSRTSRPFQVSNARPIGRPGGMHVQGASHVSLLGSPIGNSFIRPGVITSALTEPTNPEDSIRNQNKRRPVTDDGAAPNNIYIPQIQQSEFDAELKVPLEPVTSQSSVHAVNSPPPTDGTSFNTDKETNAQYSPPAEEKRTQATITRKTSADTITNVGGQSLRTYNVGCKSGKKCSFIISVPTKVPEPTYTPYSKSAVDSYLAHYQKLLSQARAPSPMEKYLEDQAAKKRSESQQKHRDEQQEEDIDSTRRGIDASEQSAALASERRDVSSYSVASQPEVLRRPVPGYAPVMDGWRRVQTQRRRPGTASLFGALRRSDTGPFASPNLYHKTDAYRSGRTIATGSEQKEHINRRDFKDGELQTPSKGRPWSKFTVERIDPLTNSSLPTPWSSITDTSADSGMVYRSGNIFRAHLSSGPITFRSESGAKQARVDPYFKSETEPNNQNMARIITSEGLRDFPNIAYGRAGRRDGSGTSTFRRSHPPAETPPVNRQRPYRRRLELPARWSTPLVAPQ